MTCKKCKEVQMEYALNSMITPTNYFRLGVANIQIICCKKHLLELQKKLEE